MMAMTLPLTLLGFELRRELGNLGDEEWFSAYDQLGPTGYMMELIRRSGYWGLLEVPMAIDGDVDRGNFWLNAPLGPSVEQLVRGATGGVFEQAWWASAAPGAAIPAWRKFLAGQ
jgi:hypothetical protein